MSQVTATGTHGTCIISIPGAGAQVTGHGTRGSVGSSTGAGAVGASTGLHGICVGPSCGPSSVKGTGRS